MLSLLFIWKSKKWKTGKLKTDPSETGNYLIVIFILALHCLYSKTDNKDSSFF